MAPGPNGFAWQARKVDPLHKRALLSVMPSAHDLMAAAEKLGGDVYLYNGPMARPQVLPFMEQVGTSQRHNAATLILVTAGGDPDAAFKIARYFQQRYTSFTVLVSGLCKSAGTLLAVGAETLAFTPYGELGPLDIQLSKVDRFEQAQSGLTISDSLITLEERAVAMVYRTARELLEGNQGMISFAAASQVAVEAMKGVYAPVMGRIDPEEIGVRSRAMRIAQDYGSRLAQRWGNPKPATLRLLAETYSSHSFVIDRSEAEALFNNVREATSEEKALVALLGNHARSPAGDVSFFTLHGADDAAASKEGDHDRQEGDGSSPEHGGDPQTAGGASGSEAAANDRPAAPRPDQSLRALEGRTA
jgi:hypothetical protein